VSAPRRYLRGEWQDISQPLFLGWNAQTGRRVFVTLKQRSTHMMDIGRSGAGKTTHYEHLIRQDIRAGRGVCVIDPEGTLYPKILSYCAKRRGCWDRLILIDPNEDNYRFGLNYFDIPFLTSQQRVDLFVQACYKILKQSDKGLLVQFERWGNASAKPLASYPAGSLTMAELEPFLTDENFRQAVLSQLPDRDYAVRQWDHWKEDLTKTDRQFAILSVLNRASLFSKDDRFEEILGQPNRIDWLDAMDRGAIVLVNLQPRKITAELSEMLGIMLIHQLVEAGLRRSDAPTNRPFYAYVDELATMATPDFARAYKQLRKRSVPFIVAMQDMADLDIDDHGKLRSAVINSSDNKLVFGMQNPDDAEELAKILFSSEIANDNIKFQAPDVKYAVPIPMSEEVERVSFTHASSRGHDQGSGRGGGNTSGDSQSQTFDPERDELLTTTGLNHGAAANWQESSRESWAEQDSMTSQTVTERWTDYEYFVQPQTPVFYSPEEMAKKYAAQIMRQPVGYAILKYDSAKPAILLRTPVPGSREFPDVAAGPSLLEECREYVYRRLGVPTAAQARAEIDDRRRRVLALSASTAEPLEREGAFTQKRRAARKK